MKEIYLDIMEKALSAYTPERIREYINEVREKGLTEHGFPRLGANIGILMAHGRQLELKAVFIEIINLCVEGFAHPAGSVKAGNNFAVREVCFALMELEKTEVIDRKQLKAWKEKLAVLDPETLYTHIVSHENPTPANWACFAVLSEQARALLCGHDATAFLEHQLPSQLLRLDENGMYRDGNITGPHQPVVYDVVTRNLIGLSLFLGYRGKYSKDIEAMMDYSDELTLKMQSVTGEMPFGGRSNQCIHNEMMLANYCELRATLLSRKGNSEKAAEFKAAAEKATKATLCWLNKKPVSHIKNHFDVDLQLGCENYAYFNKYMITVASNAYLAYLVADDCIKFNTILTERGGYVAETGPDFHKVVLTSGGYFVEYDLNADPQYDASGLGRVQKVGCDSRVCLSVPFPDENAAYKLEKPNWHPLSICGYKETEAGLLVGSGLHVEHRLTAKTENAAKCSATFECILGNELLFHETVSVSKDGVDIKVNGADGILIPAFMFDGQNETEVIVSTGEMIIKYNGSFCKYTFSGTAAEYGTFFNRNGRYRVYKIFDDNLHIELGDMNE